MSNLNCGFPSAALNKVITKLEDEKTNYSVVDKYHSYEEIAKMNFKNKNKYNDINKLESVEKLLYEYIDKGRVGVM